MCPQPDHPPIQHVSPRLANRQLKFFFHILRHKITLKKDAANMKQTQTETDALNACERIDDR
ncbi:hypothetical protein LTS12_027669, partial [Elasticomyces elasticus]